MSEPHEAADRPASRTQDYPWMSDDSWLERHRALVALDPERKRRSKLVGQDVRSEESVRLRLFPTGGSDISGEDQPISDASATAFMPAAALDADGRLHVIFYDSAGTVGVLKYTRSLSADLRAGFETARIVDSGACPGSGWYPEFGSAASDRRLREYIDLAIDSRRVHMAWTHAPTLPSRIWTSHLDF